MNYLGDFAEDATVHFAFTTHAQSGAAVAPSTAFEAADLIIYKNGSATQKTTTNGVTMTSPFDSITGLHNVDIDTSVDTGDTGFWVAGADYMVVLSPDTETVDSLSVVKIVASWSLENRNVKATLSAAERNSAADALLDRSDAIVTGITPRKQMVAAYLADAAPSSGMTAAGGTAVFTVGGKTLRADLDAYGNRNNVSNTL